MTDDFLDDDDLMALQADLDSAFADTASGGGSSGGGGSGGLDPESVRPFLKLICAQASSVITTVLSKNVDFRIDKLMVPSDDSVGGEFSKGSLMVKVNFQKDLQGSFYFIVEKRMAAVLADLMMMGDGTAEFEEDHKDALMELVNQIMGSVVTSGQAEFSVNYSVSQAEIDDYSPSSIPFALDEAVQARIDLKVEDISDTKVLFFVDSRLTQSMEHATGKGEPDQALDFDSLGQEMEKASSPGTSSFSGGGGGFSGKSGGGGGGFSLSGMTGNRALDMLLDIELNITIELGRTQMSLKRILEMGPGSIVEMDRFAGEPVDLLVNDKIVARGEVVVVDENFGIRIVSLITPEERIKSLR